MKLYVRTGPRAGDAIVIPFGQVLTVGRNKDANLSFDDTFMSGTHFEIENVGEFAKVRDRQSRNKTWVNNIAVSVANVRPGDLVRAGRTMFLLEFVSPPPVPENSIAPPEAHVATVPIWDAQPASSRSASGLYADTIPQNSEAVSRDDINSQSPQEPSIADALPLHSDKAPWPDIQRRDSLPQDAMDVLPSNCLPSNSVENSIDSSFFGVTGSYYQSEENPIAISIGDSRFSYIHDGDRGETQAKEAIGPAAVLMELYDTSELGGRFAELITKLSRFTSVGVVAHFKRIGLTWPANLQAVPIFPEFRAVQSMMPQVVEGTKWLEHVKQATTARLLANDGLLLVLLARSSEAFDNIQHLSGKGIEGYSEEAGFLGWCWPSQWTTIGRIASASQVRGFMGESITGIICLAPGGHDLVQAWVVAEQVESLKRIGFSEKT
jgi:hypothetical protein